jgi:cytochrome c-type biogenesis protein CcmH/NrfG
VARENYPKALKVLESRAAFYPHDTEHVATLADAYADHGRWEDAARTYEAAVALDPSDPDLHNSLGTVYLDSLSSLVNYGGIQ